MLIAVVENGINLLLDVGVAIDISEDGSFDDGWKMWYDCALAYPKVKAVMEHIY